MPIIQLKQGVGFVDWCLLSFHHVSYYHIILRILYKISSVLCGNLKRQVRRGFENFNSKYVVTKFLLMIIFIYGT